MKGRIVAVANEKGGVGKTATVVNLGAALAAEGKRVLILDMDPQHNASVGLGVVAENGTPTAYDLMMNGHGIDGHGLVQRTQWLNLDIIPSSSKLAQVEHALAYEEGRETKLAEALRPIAAGYDVVFIDTAPRLSLLTVNVFACATEVLVPCQTQPYAYQALEDLFDTIAMIKEEMNPELDMTGILLTFYDTRTRISRDIFDQIRNDIRYKDLLFSSVIRTNVTIAESTEAARPVMEFQRNCSGAEDYRNLAREFGVPVFL